MVVTKRVGIKVYLRGGFREVVKLMLQVRWFPDIVPEKNKRHNMGGVDELDFAPVLNPA